ncbi:7-carboxy-7-deazaguanine synthase QueE [Psychrobacter sanguinis]|uniref:7-carboxy-7-deazaguanine synthase QueE n=1 Tax=Psychrobacter sanguinis TaxID=861445 RepID=UPI00020C793F|nr:7-carboxy-7-deazaguanine synthase QueE [Psychrobacter sanguinis]EGK15086.1 radical activating enzyme [Psychrobacter sp. 1501(2011)]MCD9151165.1 7-carboxy-7-deazaguanine synthase QueE [Psychrobacter sanguinis]HBH34062.1 7-carboxy-7-deazaguanine synthase QueE [Psychrobacter sp.]
MTQATPLRSQSIPVTDPEAGLRMTEIFYSLQGEALTSGLPTVFVRLTGCPLRCVYCDTTYSFTGGERLSLEAIMADIAQYPCKRVCITGGEPLAQPNCIALINRLLEAGYEISLETAGALSVADVPEAVSKVMDIKTPSSGESDKNLWSNLNYLTQHDQLKFVIMNRSDYEWSKQQLIDYKLDQKVGTVWFSPMFNVNDSKDSAVEVPNLARELAEWILEDAIPVRLQLQLHKIIWADAKGK